MGGGREARGGERQGRVAARGRRPGRADGRPGPWREGERRGGRRGQGSAPGRGRARPGRGGGRTLVEGRAPGPGARDLGGFDRSGPSGPGALQLRSRSAPAPPKLNS